MPLLGLKGRVIDECLTLELVETARCLNHPESTHVLWVGKAGWKNWQLKPFILEGDWTFVRRNSEDFRRDAERPGTNMPACNFTPASSA